MSGTIQQADRDGECRGDRERDDGGSPPADAAAAHEHDGGQQRDEGAGRTDQHDEGEPGTDERDVRRPDHGAKRSARHHFQALVACHHAGERRAHAIIRGDEGAPGGMRDEHTIAERAERNYLARER